MSTDPTHGTPYFYALTLSGEERHIFVPLPDHPACFPGDAVSLCGKLLRYQLPKLPWADAVPACRLCTARHKPFIGHLSTPTPRGDTSCPSCPPGYDCESGNYSYDDFETIRDEQAARLAGDSGEEARPWCGAPRELGGQQPCPIGEPCDERICRIGSGEEG